MSVMTGLVAGLFLAALTFVGLNAVIVGVTPTDDLIRNIVPVVVGCVVAGFSIRLFHA